MIDIHSHVLPFVDDGSPDTESSLNLLKDCVKVGITNLFLTPHFMKTRNFLSLHESNQKVFIDFQESVKKAGIPIHLYLGNEIYYTINTVRDLQNRKVVPLGNSKMVLVEFSTIEEEEDISEAIHNLKAAGYQAVIAHTERYPYLKFADYAILKKMGALVQINASSITGKYGFETQKMVLKLIKAGIVDFVASDIHTFRPNHMKEAYEIVLKKFGKIEAEKIFNNSTVLQ